MYGTMTPYEKARKHHKQIVSMMDCIVDLEKQIENRDKINSARSLEDLAVIIMEMSNSEGIIKGHIKNLDAYKMADACRNFTLESRRRLTRKYGIRQQAIMLYLQEQNKLN